MRFVDRTLAMNLFSRGSRSLVILLDAKLLTDLVHAKFTDSQSVLADRGLDQLFDPAAADASRLVG